MPHARVSAATIGDWDRRRFRANIVADGAGEDALVGATIAVGTVQLEVAARIVRCVMVSRPQPGLARDLDVLRTLHGDRESRLGIGALVVGPGTIRTGDVLRTAAL